MKGSLRGGTELPAAGRVDLKLSRCSADQIFTSSKPEFTREFVKFEILIIDKLRFKSTKSDLWRPSSSAFCLPCVYSPDRSGSFIGCSSLWSLGKSFLFYLKLKSMSMLLPVKKLKLYHAHGTALPSLHSLLAPSCWEAPTPHSFTSHLQV